MGSFDLIFTTIVGTIIESLFVFQLVAIGLLTAFFMLELFWMGFSFVYGKDDMFKYVFSKSVIALFLFVFLWSYTPIMDAVVFWISKLALAPVALSKAEVNSKTISFDKTSAALGALMDAKDAATVAKMFRVEKGSADTTLQYSPIKFRLSVVADRAAQVKVVGAFTDYVARLKTMLQHLENNITGIDGHFTWSKGWDMLRVFARTSNANSLEEFLEETKELSSDKYMDSGTSLDNVANNRRTLHYFLMDSGKNTSGSGVVVTSLMSLLKKSTKGGKAEFLDLDKLYTHLSVAIKDHVDTANNLVTAMEASRTRLNDKYQVLRNTKNEKAQELARYLSREFAACDALYMWATTYVDMSKQFMEVINSYLGPDTPITTDTKLRNTADIIPKQVRIADSARSPLLPNGFISPVFIFNTAITFADMVWAAKTPDWDVGMPFIKAIVWGIAVICAILFGVSYVLVVIELTLYVGLAVLIIPLGAFAPLGALAKSFINGFVTVGLKYMFSSTLALVSVYVMDTVLLKFGGTAATTIAKGMMFSGQTAIDVLVPLVIMATLSMKAPSIASGLVSGNVDFHGGAMGTIGQGMQMGMQAARMGLGAAKLSGRLGQGLLQKGASLGGAHDIASAASEQANVGAGGGMFGALQGAKAYFGSMAQSWDRQKQSSIDRFLGRQDANPMRGMQRDMNGDGTADRVGPPSVGNQSRSKSSGILSAASKVVGSSLPTATGAPPSAGSTTTGSGDTSSPGTKPSGAQTAVQDDQPQTPPSPTGDAPASSPSRYPRSHNEAAFEFINPNYALSSGAPGASSVHAPLFISNPAMHKTFGTQGAIQIERNMAMVEGYEAGAQARESAKGKKGMGSMLLSIDEGNRTRKERKEADKRLGKKVPKP